MNPGLVCLRFSFPLLMCVYVCLMCVYMWHICVVCVCVCIYVVGVMCVYVWGMYMCLYVWHVDVDVCLCDECIWCICVYVCGYVCTCGVYVWGMYMCVCVVYLKQGLQANPELVDMLVSSVSLLWGSPVSTSKAIIIGRLPHPPGIVWVLRIEH